MMARWGPWSNERGAGYVLMICVIVLIGVSTGIVSQQWKVVVQRDHEAELIFRGTQIKNAIERYAADFQVRKGTRPNKYPVTLEQLTQGAKPYLAKVYRDPLTQEDFDVIKVGGEIRGIKSRSLAQPYNRVLFSDAKTYAQIVFEVVEPDMPRCGAKDNGPQMTCRN
jgi:type II secretory pathway pseudopilin PulG